MLLLRSGWHAAFQLFKPIQHHVDLRGRLGLLGAFEHQETLAVRGQVVVGQRSWSGHVSSLEEHSGFAGRNGMGRARLYRGPSWGGENNAAQDVIEDGQDQREAERANLLGLGRALRLHGRPTLPHQPAVLLVVAQRFRTISAPDGSFPGRLLSAIALGEPAAYLDFQEASIPWVWGDRHGRA